MHVLYSGHYFLSPQTLPFRALKTQISSDALSADYSLFNTKLCHWLPSFIFFFFLFESSLCNNFGFCTCKQLIKVCSSLSAMHYLKVTSEK